MYGGFIEYDYTCDDDIDFLALCRDMPGMSENTLREYFDDIEMYIEYYADNDNYLSDLEDAMEKSGSVLLEPFRTRVKTLLAIDD